MSAVESGRIGFADRVLSPSATEPLCVSAHSGNAPLRVGNASLYLGDCLATMAELEPESVDSCVCDPPYHLTSIVKRFGAANAAPAQIGATGAYARASRGFMGQQWDGGDVAFRPETWEAVYRVLKPGAHLIAFSGTRTYHRMVCAIEDAGLEIRDQLAWVYGSGFPKSHDVSKQIDKARDDRSEIEHVRAWLEERRRASGLTRKAVNAALGLADNGGGLMSSWTTNRTTVCVPQWEQWLQLKSLLGFDDEMDAEVWRLNGRKGQPGENWSVIGERKASAATGGVYGDFAQRVQINEPTDQAREWQGWGTALKPAWEPICLARKPLQGTVAANVLAHGTGAINIDGCRIPAAAGDEPLAWEHGRAMGYGGAVDNGPCNAVPQPIGRWPANIIHDGSEEVLAHFPETTSGAIKAGRAYNHRGCVTMGAASGVVTRDFEADSGSAARFFYCAKTSAAERHAGCDDLEKGNAHPTVKPIDLMRYLTRLVTPKGGLVLDPFAGSGSTLIAASWEGFRSLGCELSPEYLDIAERRLIAAQKEIEDAQRQLSMFMEAAE